MLFAEGLMKANMKIARLSEFLILESKLFHSIIVEGKKEFMFNTEEEYCFYFLSVIYASLAVGINSKRYLGDWFFENGQSFLYHCRY